MSNQRLMKAKEKAGDGYAKTNAIDPPPGFDTDQSATDDAEVYAPTARNACPMKPSLFEARANLDGRIDRAVFRLDDGHTG